MAKLRYLPENQRSQVAGGLTWINAQRIEQGFRQQEVLRSLQIQFHNQGVRVLDTICGTLGNTPATKRYAL